jgi:hypothetical protein
MWGEMASQNLTKIQILAVGAGFLLFGMWVALRLSKKIFRMS